MPGTGSQQPKSDPSDWIVLVVTDDVLLASGATGHDPDRGRFVYGFADVKPELLARIAPRTVIAPLVARDFDATDLLGRLDRLGYEGQVLFIADTTLCHDLLKEELEAIAPGLDIDLVTLDEL